MHDSLADAFDRTRAAGGARVRSSARRGGPLGTEVSFRFEGVVDFRSGVVAGRQVPLAGRGRRAAALLIRPFRRTAGAVLAPRPSVHTYAPGVMYRQVDRGRHWVRYGNLPGSPDGRLSTDPLWLFDQLCDAVPNLHPARHEAGIHWRGELDLSALARAVPTLEPMLRIGASAPVEVWTNPQGVIERLSHAVIATGDRGRRAAAAARLAHWTTTELSDHGAHEALELPPEELVVRPPDVRHW